MSNIYSVDGFILEENDYICIQCGPDSQGPDSHQRNYHMLSDDSSLPIAINNIGLLKVCLTDASGDSLTLKDLPKIIRRLQEQIPQIDGAVLYVKDDKGDYVELTKKMLKQT